MPTNIRIAITDLEDIPVVLARVEIFDGDTEIRGFTSKDGKSSFEPDAHFANRVLTVKVSKEGFVSEAKECSVVGEEVSLNFRLRPAPNIVDHIRQLRQWWPLLVPVLVLVPVLAAVQSPSDALNGAVIKYGPIVSGVLVGVAATVLLARFPIYIGIALPLVLCVHLINVLIPAAWSASTKSAWEVVVAFPIIVLTLAAMMKLDASRTKLLRIRFIREKRHIREERIRAQWHLEKS